jgi:predicted RND superfamily exporter protein
VLAIAVAAALVGWVVEGGTEVVSDLQRLAPGDLREVRDARTLERETGVSGDLNVVVRGEELTSPAVIRWMSDYQERVLDRHGYSEERTCRQAELCPALSVTNLFGSAGTESPERIRALLEALPPYFSRSVISPDRRSATIAFGVRAMPLDEQKELVDDLRAQLDPPAGVRAELAGPPVLASDANAELESSARLLTLAALALVFVVLFALYRRVDQVIVLLIPIVLAGGWSALVLFALPVPLNPLSAALGALVIAVCAQLAVILSARYRRERRAGRAPAAALTHAYDRAGPTVFASGAVAIAGLAALIASDVRMLRDFGFVAVVDLAVVLVGVMVVLPAALVWAEQWRPAQAIRGLPRRVRRAAPAGARSARGGR